MMLESGTLRDSSMVCDFGCAAGEFLHHLSQRFPHAEYHGYDIVPEFIEKAQKLVDGAAFHAGSVLDRSLLPSDSVDIACLIGVHSYFDEFETCFSNLIHWTRSGGRIYVHGQFNPYPIDVWIKYRVVGHPDPNHREPGWNFFSKSSVSTFLDNQLGPGKHTFFPFELPIDLPYKPEDPVRSWTFRDSNDRRILRNGLSLINHLETLEIRP